MNYLFVTGSRNFIGPVPPEVWELIRRADAVVHGAAEGFDSVCGQIAEDLGTYVLPVPAVGGVSPLRRNTTLAEMAGALRTLGHHVRCVACVVHPHPCNGTRDTVRKMRSRGVVTRLVEITL